MAKARQNGSVEVTVTLILSETEARALEAITGYGDDAFLTTFYQLLGRHYLRPHEEGVRSLFTSIRQTIPSILARADLAREAFNA